MSGEKVCELERYTQCSALRSALFAELEAYSVSSHVALARQRAPDSLEFLWPIHVCHESVANPRSIERDSRLAGFFLCQSKWKLKDRLLQMPTFQSFTL